MSTYKLGTAVQIPATTSLRASDGVELGTFPVGHELEPVAFDGANIWVTNRADDTVSKL